ncbi:DUF3299 domain-containing protein [Vibrio sp. 10N.222.51.C12]|uniref:DUF3299 domain-containing protein n=1 Tax=unclassified Vibrio TaxID=2614977 RepID=UPI000CC69CEA|nr:DUF3299 domain-containing protein [Vibrio sp. 10N.286.48.B7]PMH79332.1 hypothetical protein BCU58_05585 [Vibrio sp. 10N.286.48.B7]
MKKMINSFVVLGLIFSHTIHAEQAILSWLDMVPIEERHSSTPVSVNHEESLDARAPQSLVGKTITALNNTEQRIAGFVVPLEINGNKIESFLLVPFFGACLHVPPPPPNQIVYVEQTIDYIDPWEPIVIDGTLKVTAQQQQEISSGYQLVPSGGIQLLKTL